MDLGYVVVGGPKSLENHLAATVTSGGLNRNPGRINSIDACLAMIGTVPIPVFFVASFWDCDLGSALMPILV